MKTDYEKAWNALEKDLIERLKKWRTIKSEYPELDTRTQSYCSSISHTLHNMKFFKNQYQLKKKWK